MKKDLMINLPVHFMKYLSIFKLIKQGKEGLKLFNVKIGSLDNLFSLTSPKKILLIHFTHSLFNRIILNNTKSPAL